MKKPEPVTSKEDVTDLFLEDNEFLTMYPNLFHYLVDERWDDGSPREKATLLLFVDAGRLKGMLNDKAMRRIAWLSSTSLAGLLGSFESGLETGALEWRADKHQGRGRR